MPGIGDDGSHKLGTWLMIPQPEVLIAFQRFMPGSDQHTAFPNKPHLNTSVYEKLH